jgi:hypothetical protein
MILAVKNTCRLLLLKEAEYRMWIVDQSHGSNYWCKSKTLLSEMFKNGSSQTFAFHSEQYALII